MSKLGFINRILSHTPIGGEKTPKISREESLRGIPVIRQGLETHENDKGERLLLVPRRPMFNLSLLQRIMPSNLEPLKVILDDMGNHVWNMIDGKRSVKAISRDFAREMGIHNREAEASVVAFLSMLMKRGLVTIIIP